jgi:2-methylcitrate dehydratase PrpD
MPYAAAVALMYGTVEEQYYEDPYLHDRRLLDLVGRVRCLPSEEADRVEREMNLCDLEIVLRQLWALESVPQAGAIIAATRA